MRIPHNKGKITPNKLIKRAGAYYLELTHRDGSISGYAIIDKEDYEKVRGYRWSKRLIRGLKPYVYNNYLGKYTAIHYLIMGGKGIDHINQNGLDNRKRNLRFADATLQNINKPLQKNNKSGIRGVYFRTRIISGKRYSYWVATIAINNKTINLGQSKNKEKAIVLRKKAENKYFKNYG